MTTMRAHKAQSVNRAPTVSVHRTQRSRYLILLNAADCSAFCCATLLLATLLSSFAPMRHTEFKEFAGDVLVDAGHCLKDE